MNMSCPARPVAVPVSSFTNQSPSLARSLYAKRIAPAAFFNTAVRGACKAIPLIWLSVASCAPAPGAYQTRPAMAWDAVNGRWVVVQTPASSSSAYRRGAALAGANGLAPNGPPQVPATPRQYAPPPPPTPEMQKYFSMLSAAVKQDTVAWENKQLDPDSFHHFHAYEDGHGMCDNQCSEITQVYGDYTFNGGKPGFVMADIKAGHVACLHYEDTPGACDPVRTAEDVRRKKAEDARQEAAIRNAVLHPPPSASTPSAPASKNPGYFECHALYGGHGAFAAMAGCYDP
jgi:hypothetical protein